MAGAKTKTPTKKWAFTAADTAILLVARGALGYEAANQTGSLFGLVRPKGLVREGNASVTKIEQARLNSNLLSRTSDAANALTGSRDHWACPSRLG